MSSAPREPTVLERFGAATAAAGGRAAIVSGDVSVSYATLAEQTDRLAGVLRADGVRPGARVALVIDGSVDFVRAYLGILKAGAVAVPVDPGAPVSTLTRVFEDCAPAAAFVARSCAAALPGLVAATPGLRLAYMTGSTEDGAAPWIAGSAERLPDAGRPQPAGAPPEDGLAAIIYTSGTTGPPKGVSLSHANMAAIEAAGRQLLGLGPGDCIGLVAPVFHLYGLREIDAALSVGATLVLPRETSYPARVLEQLHAARVTGISSVPSALAILLERYRNELAACAGHLRYLTIGTAPTPSAVLDALRVTLPQTRLITTYGLTEASRVCWADATIPGPPREPGAVGHPYPGVEVALEDQVDGVGRVTIRSAMVMKGYWNRPEATGDTLAADGALRTPDCGWIGRDGTVHLLGRIDDVINCGGQKVSPHEVEEVLSRHPGVAAVTVLAAPDPDGVLGQVVRAVVVRRDGSAVSAVELLAHAASALERYKVPRSVEFTRRIPQTILGKPQRPLLRREAERA